jgi:hypothetical protein
VAELEHVHDLNSSCCAYACVDVDRDEAEVPSRARIRILMTLAIAAPDDVGRKQHSGHDERNGTGH